MTFTSRHHNLQCFTSDEHAQLRNMAYALIALWPVGAAVGIETNSACLPSFRALCPLSSHRKFWIRMPLAGVPALYAALLIATRTSILNRMPTHLTFSVAFLHGDFHTEYYYWELVELARRTILYAIRDRTHKIARKHLALRLSCLVLGPNRSPMAGWDGCCSSMSAAPLFVSWLRFPSACRRWCSQ